MPGYVRAAERREQLLAAARAVLVREGLEGLTLRDVAAEASVHLSTLQYIFSSRGELIHALAERVLADAGYQQLEVREDGLAVELDRHFQWYAQQFLEDPAMLELARHELVATVGGVARREAELPLGRPLLPHDLEPRISRIAECAGETYQRPVADLARLWTLAGRGMLHEFLVHRDLDRFRADAEVVRAAIISIAAPTRRMAVRQA